jgi:hypothetical protein
MVGVNPLHELAGFCLRGGQNHVSGGVKSFGGSPFATDISVEKKPQS